MNKKKIIIVLVIASIIGGFFIYADSHKVIKQVAEVNKGTANSRVISKDEVYDSLSPYFRTVVGNPSDKTTTDNKLDESAATSMGASQQISTNRDDKIVTAKSYDGKAETKVETSNGEEFKKITVISKLDNLENESLTKSICEHLDPVFLSVCYDKTVYTKYIAFVRDKAAKDMQSGEFSKETMTGVDEDLNIELVFDSNEKIITLTIQK